MIDVIDTIKEKIPECVRDDKFLVAYADINNMFCSNSVTKWYFDLDTAVEMNENNSPIGVFLFDVNLILNKFDMDGYVVGVSKDKTTIECFNTTEGEDAIVSAMIINLNNKTVTIVDQLPFDFGYDIIESARMTESRDTDGILDVLVQANDIIKNRNNK